MGPMTGLSAIEVAAKIKEAYSASSNSTVANTLKNRSLVDVASAARVEPIVLVDADCLSVDALPDVMQSLHSMFAGYYLQAVNMIMPVGGVTVAQRLAPFNPNAMGSAFESLMKDIKASVSLEEYRYKFPQRKDKPEQKHQISLEDNKADRDALSAVRDASNLAVGKVFNVNLGENITMPVTIRLLVSSVPSKAMVNVMSAQDVLDQDLGERFHGWRSGRLRFWQDLVLCNDLVDKRIKSSIQDPTGVLAIIRKRQSSNTLSGLSGGQATVANATNMAVLSSDTADEIEMAVGGPFSNPKARKAIFDSTNLMIIAVVNKHWERVTFWVRGQDISSTMSYREIKSAAKDSGSNVTDILKAYISGASL